jgi:hypothetical protein
MDGVRTFRFAITAFVEDDHEAYADPEWVADAAAGALANVYGVRCIYTDIEEITDP